jgi:hypothetical protein
VIPESPNFRSRSEEKVFKVLIENLSPEDVLVCNFEFTDMSLGDVEIDFILLVKDIGLAIVEVKGGHITFDGNNWIQSDSKSRRIIFPAAQAKGICIHFENFYVTVGHKEILSQTGLCVFQTAKSTIHLPQIYRSKKL